MRTGDGRQVNRRFYGGPPKGLILDQVEMCGLFEFESYRIGLDSMRITDLRMRIFGLLESQPAGIRIIPTELTEKFGYEDTPNSNWRPKARAFVALWSRTKKYLDFAILRILGHANRHS